MDGQRDDYLIGYLAHYVSQDTSYYGGLLVTNISGIPREFRHSEAIKPSKLQVILYGDSLKASLGAEALAPALYGALARTPDLLMIDKDSRELFGPYVVLTPPAALLVSHPDPDLAFADQLTQGGDLLEAREYKLKGSTTERAYAYIEESHGSYTGSKILDMAQSRMNLVSPFNRIRITLSEIAQVEQSRRA